MDVFDVLALYLFDAMRRTGGGRIFFLNLVPTNRDVRCRKVQKGDSGIIIMAMLGALDSNSRNFAGISSVFFAIAFF